ncbi:MAG: hypothetical protein ABII09_01565 [Planctomycetota bacterium]
MNILIREDRRMLGYAFSAKGILEASFFTALRLRSQNPENTGFFLSAEQITPAP